MGTIADNCIWREAPFCDFMGTKNKQGRFTMELLLKNYEILELGDDPRGLRILCRQGHCWLTQAGDSRDHILHPGDSHRVNGRGRMLLTAGRSCRIVLQSDGAKRPLRLAC